MPDQQVPHSETGGWVSLRDYVDVRFEASGEALRLVADKQDLRFGTVEQTQGKSTERIEALERRNANMDGRLWMFATVLTLGLTILSIAVGVLLKFL